jgi:hypothetical protein
MQLRTPPLDVQLGDLLARPAAKGIPSVALVPITPTRRPRLLLLILRVDTE